jgi:hypothetical protein
MTSLQDLTSEADKAKRTLTLGTPQTDDALAIMEATEGVLVRQPHLASTAAALG